MSADDTKTTGALAKVGAWLKANKAFAIPVAAAVVGFGAASLSRRRESREAFEDGFESGWEARDRREADEEEQEE